jgi:hypothetical protein
MSSCGSSSGMKSRLCWQNRSASAYFTGMNFLHTASQKALSPSAETGAAISAITRSLNRSGYSPRKWNRIRLRNLPGFPRAPRCDGARISPPTSLGPVSSPWSRATVCVVPKFSPLEKNFFSESFSDQFGLPGPPIREMICEVPITPPVSVSTMLNMNTSDLAFRSASPLCERSARFFAPAADALVGAGPFPAVRAKHVRECPIFSAMIRSSGGRLMKYTIRASLYSVPRSSGFDWRIRNKRTSRRQRPRRALLASTRKLASD